MKKRMLVTGGAGFIGTHAVDWLRAEGHIVTVFDDGSGARFSKPEEGWWSVNDAESLEVCFEEFKPQIVYHLAAYAAEGLSHFIRRFNYTNNVVGSMNVINECIVHDVECLVFTSSIAVYGAGRNPMRESDIPTPEDPYGIAKYAVELDLEAAHRMFGLRSVVLRPHNVYGPLQNTGDRYRNVVGLFINQMLRGEKLTVFGDGLQTRQFTYIDDLKGQFLAAPELVTHRVFNVGSDAEPRTVLDVATLVCREFGVDPAKAIEFLPARKEVVHAHACHDRIKSRVEIGSTSLEKGISEMVAWARTVGPQEPSTFSGIELTKNLPSVWQRK